MLQRRLLPEHRGQRALLPQHVRLLVLNCTGGLVVDRGELRGQDGPRVLVTQLDLVLEAH